MQNDRGDIIHTPAQAAAIATALLIAEEKPTPAPETPSDVVARLEAEYEELRTKLAALNAAALQGDIQTIRSSALSELTIQLAATRNALEAARQAGSKPNKTLWPPRNWSARGDFPRPWRRLNRHGPRPAVLTETWRLRWAGIARQLEAIVLNGELRAAFPDPDRWNLIHDIENRATLIPLHELRDSGYSPLMDFGHDLSITVPPLLEPGKKRKLKWELSKSKQHATRKQQARASGSRNPRGRTGARPHQPNRRAAHRPQHYEQWRHVELGRNDARC